MHLWTNICSSFACFASTVNKDDFSILSIACNTVLVLNIWMRISSAFLAGSWKQVDLGVKSAWILHAFSGRIGRNIKWSWMIVVWASFASTSDQEFLSCEITWVWIAFSSLRVWMGPSWACLALSIFFQDLSD